MKSYLIECAEINYFTVEVDAECEDEARALVRENINNFDVIDEWVSDWDINDVKEIAEVEWNIFMDGHKFTWKSNRLTFEEHHHNNEWFNNMLAMLKPDGKLFVPLINKSFNKLGEEVWQKLLQ